MKLVFICALLVCFIGLLRAETEGVYEVKEDDVEVNDRSLEESVDENEDGDNESEIMARSLEDADEEDDESEIAVRSESDADDEDQQADDSQGDDKETVLVERGRRRRRRRKLKRCSKRRSVTLFVRFRGRLYRLHRPILGTICLQPGARCRRFLFFRGTCRQSYLRFRVRIRKFWIILRIPLCLCRR